MKQFYARFKDQTTESQSKQDDQTSTVFPFKRRQLNPIEKPLLPTLCDGCYQSFEIAVESAIDKGVNFVACYCPHTLCLVTVEMIGEDEHCTGVYGPMQEDMAKELVNERFGEMDMDLSSGSFQQ
jgi:hypothetical protein